MPLDEHCGLGGLGAAGGKTRCPDCFYAISPLCLSSQEFIQSLKTPDIPLPGTSLILKTCMLFSQYRDSCPVGLYTL